MHDKELIDKAKKLYNADRSVSAVSQLSKIPLSTVQYMVANDHKPKKKRGKAFLLNKRDQTRIKKEVRALNSRGEKATAPKIRANLGLNRSIRTVQRCL